MKTRNIGIILFILTFCMIATACGEKSQESSSVMLSDEKSIEVTTLSVATTMVSSTTTVTTVTTESITSMVTTMAVATTATSRTTTVTTESTTSMVTTINEEELAEKQLVKEIYMIRYPYDTEEKAEEHADYMIQRAEPFSENALGSITSGEDAKEKGRAVFVEWMGQEFVDELESDYVDVDGKHLKLERENPPYSMTYYEEYDVWVVAAILRSGLLEDGRALVHTDGSLYMILRGSDGKVLATS